MRCNRKTSTRMNHTIRLSVLSKCSLIKKWKMLHSNYMTINSFILTEVFTIRKTITWSLNHLVTKRSYKSLRTSIITNSTVKVLHKSFTSTKNNFHRTSISILIKNITYSTLKLIKSKLFTISIIVTLTANLFHTCCMRNWLSIIRVNKSNFTIHSLIILSKPKTLLVHNTTLNVKLTHFLINPKVSSTTTLSLKLISNYSVTNITSNLFRVTVELKLRSHLTRSHNITTITLRITLRNSRSSQRPISTNFQIVSRNISIWIRSCKTKTIKITTIWSFTKVFHNTNLSNTIRSNQTILLNKPMSLKLNIKHYTTLSNITCCSTSKNLVIKLHTTHSLPCPINSINIYYTSWTLTFSKECQRKSIIIHTISIGESRVNLSRFSKH